GHRDHRQPAQRPTRWPTAMATAGAAAAADRRRYRQREPCRAGRAAPCTRRSGALPLRRPVRLRRRGLLDLVPAAQCRLAAPSPRPQSALFVGLMAAIGLFASWLGTLCWNEASQRLPTALAGQLIVFETLAAL